METHLIIIPLIAAAIGWVTNLIAVKMLFHPRLPVSFLGLFKIQGVFPKRQQAFAESLGKLVSNELISTSEVSDHFKQAAVSDKNIDFILGKLTVVLNEKLPQAVPMLAMFVNPEMINTILSPLKGEIKNIISDLTSTVSAEIESTLDVHQLVADKVKNFSVEKLEQIINEIMRKELRQVEILGGVLGFLIGCVQVLLV